MSAITPFSGQDIDGLFATVLEHSFEAIVITDAIENSHNIVYVNEKFCQMTGYQREELYGKNPRILQGKRSNRQVIKRLKNAIEAANISGVDIIPITNVDFYYQGEKL